MERERLFSLVSSLAITTKQMMDLIKNYDHDLVYDQVRTGEDRVAHDIVRDSYKPGELVKILKTLWTSNKKTSLREIFSLSSRHHMLLYCDP
ncbi:unnamed protein product [Rhizopus stolonifer]